MTRDRGQNQGAKICTNLTLGEVGAVILVRAPGWAAACGNDEEFVMARGFRRVSPDKEKGRCVGTGLGLRSEV